MTSTQHITDPQPVQRLLIVSHVLHYRHQGQIFAYAPYVREIDVWADMFPEVVIASPCRDEVPPGDCRAIARDNVTMSPIRETGGQTLGAKLQQVLMLPVLIWTLCRTMRRSDAIHVRCPGNLGLLGVILAPIFSRRLIAKYAGQWTGYEGEPRTYWLQRRLLSSFWWRGPVTVYGDWPNQGANVVPFFTSIMGPAEMEQARAAAASPRDAQPLRLLFVGRLSRDKNVDTLISAVAELKPLGIDTRAEIVGVGPYREFLEAQAETLQVADCIDFVGGVEFERVFDHYAKADVLVLVSNTEGWPKAIAEAMACGVVCIGSDRGLVPWMLEDGRGFVVKPGDVAALTKAIQHLTGDSQLRREMSVQAAEWGQRYSLEDLRDALADLMSSRWGASIAAVTKSETRMASEGVLT